MGFFNFLIQKQLKSMSKQDNQFVALAHYACPICGKNDDGVIILDKCMKDISHLSGKTLEYGDPCKECQTGLDMGAIMFVVIDEKKSDPDNPWRTGNIFGIKREAAEKVLEGMPEGPAILEKQVCFIDYQAAIQIGLPVEYVP